MAFFFWGGKWSVESCPPGGLKVYSPRGAEGVLSQGAESVLITTVK